MNETLENQIASDSGEKLCKSWSYTEKNKKTVTYHTLSIKGKRFSHLAEIKDPANTMRQRTDFNLDNVRSVNSYYGVSRNMGAVIIAAVIAALLLIASIIIFAAGEGGGNIFAIVLLAIALICGVVAFFAYKNIKPTFILEIETVVPMGQITTNSFSYGNADVNFGGKKKISILKIVLSIIFLPITIIAFLFKSKNNNKYKFEMDVETGNDIVDTIGAYLIEE